MDAVHVSLEMNELTEFFAALRAHVVPDFEMHPQNVFAQDLLFVVAFIAEVTGIFPFVVVDRIDMDFDLFRTDELLAANFTRVSDAHVLGFMMLLVSAGAGEGLFAIFAFEPLGVDGYGGNIPWFPRRWQLPFRAKRRHGRGIGQGATQEADVERRQGTTHFSSRIEIFLLLFLIILLLERGRRMLAAQWQGLEDRRSI